MATATVIAVIATKIYSEAHWTKQIKLSLIYTIRKLLKHGRLSIVDNRSRRRRARANFRSWPAAYSMVWRALKQVVLSQVTLKWAEQTVALRIRTVRAMVRKMWVPELVVGVRSRGAGTSPKRTRSGKLVKYRDD
jgi:hypothetical protein